MNSGTYGFSCFVRAPACGFLGLRASKCRVGLGV